MPTETVTFIEHTARKTSGGQVHKFKLSDGRTFDAWDDALGSLGVALLTKPVQVEFQQKPSKDGRFINYTISQIAPADSSVGAQGTGGSPPAGEPSAAPPVPAGSKQVDWDAKDQRITRSFAVNASLKALEIARGDREAAEQVLKAAIELAYLPAGYSWAGPSK